MKSKILLVGGSGYLGRHLASELDNDFNLTLTGTKVMDKSAYFQVDYQNPSTYQNLKNCHFEMIVLLASSLQGLGQNNLDNDCLAINVVKFASFLQFISDEKLTQKVIYISSMTVYAPQPKLPVDENGMLGPMSTYGLSKQLAEQTVAFFANQHQIKTLILRLPGIYGGDRKAGYIYNTILKALNNQAILINTADLGYWECIEIHDLCYAIKQLMINYDWKHKVSVLNIGYGERTDFIDTAKFIVNELKSTSTLSYEGERGYEDFFMDNAQLLNLVDKKSSYFDSLRKYITYLKDDIRNR